MINLGTRWQTQLWPDDWTAVTSDGSVWLSCLYSHNSGLSWFRKPSAQFEHTILITQDGFEVLTARLPDSPPLSFLPLPEPGASDVRTVAAAALGMLESGKTFTEQGSEAAGENRGAAGEREGEGEKKKKKRRR